jgi:UTP--glucose-1-phosphate uridylyltransferase
MEEYFFETKGIHFIEDDSRSGPGGALLKAEKFVAKDEFVTVFADAPVSGKNQSTHLEKLMAAKQDEKATAVLSIYQIPKSEITSRGVVAFNESKAAEEGVVTVSDIIEKPSKDKYPSRWASTCRYVLDANIFDALRNISTDRNSELQLTPAIRYLIHKGQSVLGIPLPDHLRRHDTGNFEGYFKAFEDFT